MCAHNTQKKGFPITKHYEVLLKSSKRQKNSAAKTWRKKSLGPKNYLYTPGPSKKILLKIQEIFTTKKMKS